MKELIVAMFPYYDDYIKVAIIQGSLSVLRCPQMLYGTEDEIWQLEYIR